MWRRPNARPSSRPTPTAWAPRASSRRCSTPDAARSSSRRWRRRHSARALAPGAAIFVLDGLLPGTEQRTWRTCARFPCSRASMRFATGSRSAPRARGAAARGAAGRHRPQPPRPARCARSLVLAARRRTLAPARAHARHEPSRLRRRGRPSDERRRSSIRFDAAARAAAPDALEPRHLRRPDARPRLPFRSRAARLSRSTAARRTRARQRRCARSCASAPASCRCATCAAGGRIGYSATYRAHAPRRIATIAAGYADGCSAHASATNDAPGGAVLDRRTSARRSSAACRWTSSPSTSRTSRSAAPTRGDLGRSGRRPSCRSRAWALGRHHRL